MDVYGASQVVLVVKNPPANTGDIRDVGLIPGSGRLLEKEMAIYSSGPPEEPGRLQSIGPPRVRHDWSDLAHTRMHTRLDMYTLDMYIRSASIATIFWKSSCEINAISPLNVERNSLVKPSRPWVFYVEKILTRNSISLMDLGSLLLICVFFFFS